MAPFDPHAFNPAGFLSGGSNALLDDIPPDQLVPMFNVEQVTLQFQVASDFAAVQVANNMIVLALLSGRIMWIDLDNPSDIRDIDLPKRPSEVGAIRKLFLDPTASHLLVTTTHGENFYVHYKPGTRPRQLTRLKGVHVECVAWSVASPTASTREILLGARDGSVYETYIEGQEGSMIRREEKYLKLVYKIDVPVTGLWVDAVPGERNARRVLLSSPAVVMLWLSKVQAHEGGSIFAKFFEAAEEVVQHFPGSTVKDAMLSISPDPPSERDEEPRSFAALTAAGLYHGSLTSQPAEVLAAAKISRVLPPNTVINSIALTHYHIICLCGTTLYAINRLDDSVAFTEAFVAPGTKVLGLCADRQKSTFWAFTNNEIYEIVVTEEDRDVWKVLLKEKDFEQAMEYAKSAGQRDQIAIAQGEHLFGLNQFVEAAGCFGRSSKSFEECSLAFLENGEQEALRAYLLTKLAHMKKTAVMQRIMVASWIVEVFMSRLNMLEDALSTISSVNSSAMTLDDVQVQLSSVASEFQEFVKKYKADLDRKTTYEIISSHGREEELLFFADTVKDYPYVLAYWVQREKWQNALDVLKKQSDPQVFYKYASVLMVNAPEKMVDILMRQSYLNPRNLIPALLNYNKYTNVPLTKNQAVRYLLFVIHQLGSTDSAVHNTLISIYASHPSRDERYLLQYLESHSTDSSQYDADFALRLCIKHGHVQSCVHIYSSMNQYPQAVELALKHGNVDLASIVADRPDNDPAQRKKLWLSVAKDVIARSQSIKEALSFLRSRGCDLLKIEDLIPHFPDFCVIDDFKEDICAALDDYSHKIDALRKEMDESAKTADHIREDIKGLERRYAIVEPGERCYHCQFPLLSRLFYVFPCQHSFHGDCLTQEVVKHSGLTMKRRIEDLSKAVREGRGTKREKTQEELDRLVAGECLLCSEFAVKRIDEPFVEAGEDIGDWDV